MKRAAIPHRHPHGRAFTLVELMVIVAVIGLVSGAAFTTMAAFLQEQKLRQASLELASYLQSARARAQREGGICELAFSGASLTLIGPTAASGNVCNTPPLQPSLNLATVSGVSGLTVSGAGSTTAITLTRLGTLASQSISGVRVSAMPRMIYLSASGTSQQRCVFLVGVGIRTGWRVPVKPTDKCTYTSG
jgi:type IV fimbrial biogenesis protein FimT